MITSLSDYVDRVMLADLDNDGYPEILTVQGNAELGVIANDGNGAFGALVAVSCEGHSLTDIAVGDLDGDADPDVAIASGGDGGICWVRGSCSFTVHASHETGPFATGRHTLHPDQLRGRPRSHRASSGETMYAN